ncbi:hypothetical protein TWF694_000767 [Orbilia ellipsospora]|uniref:Uncharacterized protein n=1 Tax=Orbilia ellipsospora TaxID=2528407 RepID=A0AAV9XPY8_9PEZI
MAELRKPILVLSSPRACSNLFIKILSQHPQLSVRPYEFHNVYLFGAEQLSQRKTPQFAARIEAQTPEVRTLTYQKVFDKVTEFIEETQKKGNVPVIKEHTHQILDPRVAEAEFHFAAAREARPTPIVKMPDNNMTNDSDIAKSPLLLPSDFLVTVQPVILIRNPIRVVPSFYKVARVGFGATVDDEDWPVQVSFKSSRLVYDWYRAQGISPIVIDAYELVHKSQELMQELCTRCDIDTKGIILSWDQYEPDEVLRQQSSWFSTLWNSTKIDPSVEPEAVCIQEEFVKWKENWGEEVAMGIRRSVDIAQDDYAYLRKHALLRS